MDRDFELLRLVCIDAVENNETEFFSTDLSYESYSDAMVDYHCALLIEGGYMLGAVHGNRSRRFCLMHGLTLKGHDFLAAAKDDNAWNNALKYAKEASNKITMDVFTKVLINGLTPHLLDVLSRIPQI